MRALGQIKLQKVFKVDLALRSLLEPKEKMMKSRKELSQEQEHLQSRKSLLQTTLTMLKGLILWKVMPLVRMIGAKPAFSDM